MNISLHHEVPDSALYPKIDSLVDGADRLDLAVAFVTKRGVKAIRQLCSKMRTDAKSRLIVSVLFPTDLTAIAGLASQMEVFIHLARTERQDKLHHQFHSKLLLIRRSDGMSRVIVGSHNWTTNGLDGGNLEASAVISAKADDTITKEAVAHIDACQLRSERFDATRLDFYKAIQKKFHPRLTPLPTKRLGGFDKLNVFVILAETNSPTADIDGELYFHLPSRYKKQLDTEDQVWVFLFSSGTLFQSLASSPKALLRCKVLTKDVGLTHTINPPADSYAINELSNPVLQPVTVVPPPKPNHQLVAVKLNTMDPGPRIPMFHDGRAPAIKYEIKARPESDVYDLQLATVSGGHTPSGTRRNVPMQISLEAHLKVPFQFVLPDETSDAVRQFTMANTAHDQRLELDVVVKPARGIGQYASFARFMSNKALTAAIYQY